MMTGHLSMMAIGKTPHQIKQKHQSCDILAFSLFGDVDMRCHNRDLLTIVSCALWLTATCGMQEHVRPEYTWD
jgi:hypothetical protein